MAAGVALLATACASVEPAPLGLRPEHHGIVPGFSFAADTFAFPNDIRARNADRDDLYANYCFVLARGLRNELKAAKGSVVNVTSIAGSRVHPFAGAAYATSKAALASLTREMAADFGRLGIRVNAIAPGEIDTAILSPGTDKIVEQIPMQRLGTPDEVAKIIYVLCTETSSYVNGAEIHINGGQHV